MKSPTTARLRRASLLAVVCGLVACGCSASDEGTDGTGMGGGGAFGTGGGSAIGGGPFGTGGTSGIGGTPTGGAPLTGGALTGGASTGGTATGGASTGGSITGGALTGGASTGGSITGGASTGGADTGGASTGGASIGGTATGGAPLGGSTTGGASTGGASTGGVATGGAATGGASTGGASTGGADTGGASTGGSGNSACPGASATEFSQIAGWLDNSIAPGALPNYAYDNISSIYGSGAAFDELVCSIAMSCLEFAPNGWLRECEAVVASAIVAESSYNPESVVEDSYGGAADPTVGLLQIRFSSTVQDYNYYGPMEKMAAIGCTWPSELPNQAQDETFWRNQGANYLSFMQDVPCNVGLGTWYYFYNATGNGGATATWIFDYCAGNGTGGNMVVGLLSHLMGGNYDRSIDGTHSYPFGIECCSGGNPDVTPCTGCTGRFAAFMGIGTTDARPNPDPFTQTFAPEPEKYCR